MTVTTLAATPTSIAGLCAATRRLLSQNLNDELAFLSEPYEPGDTSVALRAKTKRLGPGSVLSWGDNTFYVVGVSTSSAAVEVVNGYDGAPSAAAAAGSPLRVNPRFSDYTIFENVASVIASLSSPANGLYGVYQQEVNGTVVDGYYPVPDEIFDYVIKALRVESRTNSSQDWIREVNYTAVLGGPDKAVRIFSEALQYRITYALKFLRPQTFSDDAIIDCGLQPSMIDIPPLGAAAVMMQGQEARRAHQRAQGDPRRAEDVPITAATASARELQRMFRNRIDEEHAALIAVNPYAGRAM